jgi:hypothetical protein
VSRAPGAGALSTIAPNAGRLSSVGLAQLVRQSRFVAPAEETCDLCAAPLSAEHRHVLELPGNELRCACRPCALLFDRREAGGERWQTVPERRRRVVDLEFDAPAASMIAPPIGLYFVTPSDEGLPVVRYPSPAGATEAEVDGPAWERLVDRNPVLADLAALTEALLIRREREKAGYWLAPIDDCYRLVAVVRSHWQGMSGGDEVWVELARFFDELSRQADPVHNDGRPAAREGTEDSA